MFGFALCLCSHRCSADKCVLLPTGNDNDDTNAGTNLSCGLQLYQ